MMYEVETTDQAETDLREIYEYIAFELLAPDHASGQLDRLEAHIERLREFPEKFRRYDKEPWHGRGMRVMPVDNSGGLFYRSPVLMKKENERKIDLRYNNDIDSFDESSSGMEGGKCVMAHQDKENDIEAAGRRLQIRNSTVDFLVFTKDVGEDGIEVRVQNHDVWLTQKAIAQLFDVDRSVVTKHLKNIFESGELSGELTCANFAQVADNGKTYQYKFYSLSAIIAVGYRTNSVRATQFRQWATKVLDTFTKQGYVLDKERLINGQIFDEDYFEHLISEIQEIRASERRFYQKITDIYTTAVDYSLDSQITRDFFAAVQNKMHYAVHGNTAAEVIVERADHNKEHMGLTTWRNAPKGKIVKADVSVAKNYLSVDEMQELNEIVTMYLDYAIRQARRHIPMTMEDWASKLDAFLQFNDAEVLQDKGKVTAAIAKTFAESEFEQYRVIQDRLYQSDFDRLMEAVDCDGDSLRE